MNNRFIVFDVETPNASNNRISSIGITIIENDVIIHSFSSLINPETHFDRFNMDLTGITPESVASMPNFAQLWEEIEPLMSSGILVAHNATFDLKVLLKCLKSYKIKWKRKVDYICTYEIARKVLRHLPNLKLNTICDYLQIDLDHHDSNSDSHACARILLYYLGCNVELNKYIHSFTLSHNPFNSIKVKNFDDEIEKIDKEPLFAIIKSTDYYKEHYEPNFLYPTSTEQWVMGEWVSEYVRTDYDVLTVFKDNTFKEYHNLREGSSILEEATEIARDDFSYDEVKRQLLRDKVLKRKNPEMLNFVERLYAIEAQDLLNANPYSRDDLVERLSDSGIPVKSAEKTADSCQVDWENQAVAKARLYLKRYAHSKSKIIELLLDLNFSQKQAEYGAEHCGANWEKEAVRCAKESLSSFSYSYKDMVVCLERDMCFQHEEAVYGADFCEADWKEEAVRSAKKFLLNSEYSFEKMIFQLEWFNFTHEEATYAAKTLGLKSNLEDQSKYGQKL